MIYRLPIFLLALLFHGSLTAQSFEFEVGASTTDNIVLEIYGAKSGTDVERRTYGTNAFNYHAAVTNTFTDFFALRLQAGTNTFRARLLHNTIDGLYYDLEGEQLSVELLPEFRLGKRHWFFANAALGWQFTHTGTQRARRDVAFDEYDSSRELRRHNCSIGGNAGGQINFKRVGLRAGYGVRYWSFNSFRNTRLLQSTFQAGLVYRLVGS